MRFAFVLLAISATAFARPVESAVEEQETVGYGGGPAAAVGGIGGAVGTKVGAELLSKPAEAIGSVFGSAGAHAAGGLAGIIGGGLGGIVGGGLGGALGGGLEGAGA